MPRTAADTVRAHERSNTYAAANLAAMLKDRTAQAVPHLIALDACELLRLSRRSDSVAVALCNGTLPPCRACRGTGDTDAKPCEKCDGDGTVWKARTRKIQDAAQEIVAPYGLTAKVGGDPRGHTLRLFPLPDTKPLRGNTWGGEESGYAIAYGEGKP
jgi:hypothetical protein